MHYRTRASTATRKLDACRRAGQTGVIIAVSAGNSNVDTPGFLPSTYDDAVIAVSAAADWSGPASPNGDWWWDKSNWGIETAAWNPRPSASVALGAPGYMVRSQALDSTDSIPVLQSEFENRKSKAICDLQFADFRGSIGKNKRIPYINKAQPKYTRQLGLTLISLCSAFLAIIRLLFIHPPVSCAT